VLLSTNRLYSTELNETIVKRSEYMRFQKEVVGACVKIMSKKVS
jgi:hypothetical protein